MRAPPSPVVLTAGVRDKGRKTPKSPSSKRGGGRVRSARGHRARSRTAPAPPPDDGGSTPPRDNRADRARAAPRDGPIAPLLVAAAATDRDDDDDGGAGGGVAASDDGGGGGPAGAAAGPVDRRRRLEIQKASVKLDDLYAAPPVIPDEGDPAEGGGEPSRASEHAWLAFCFLGIMGSFVCYGLLLEYATSGGKRLHELSFLFVTSMLYTVTASVGRYARAEKPSTIPPAQFAVLGLTSMGSTFFSVRALRYVIFPIQVLAKSCKPVPVMLMGALMGKKYPFKKYVKVVLIVGGVGLFMGGGDNKKGSDPTEEKDASSQLIGVTLLFISLCFDGGTGAYEDKLMSVHSVGPFDLMYNIQMGKTILAGIGLIVLNQVHIFAQMCQDMGFLLVALGLSGAVGQVFIFVTIAKFGALTCSIIGLARKVTTLVASIYFYGHHLNRVQAMGLIVCIGAMVNDFFGKKGKKGGGHGAHGGGGGGRDDSQDADDKDASEEQQPMLPMAEESASSLEMGTMKK